MKYKFLLFIFSVLLILSCDDEQTAGPGDTDTYIKFFGAENSDEAYVARQTSDGGAVLLATTEIDNEGSPVSKIKVVRVDHNGNQLWEKVYPEFEEKPASGGDPADYAYSLTGRSIIIVDDGYIIVGDSIQNDDDLAHSSLFLMKINDSPTDDSFEFTSMNYQNMTGSSEPYDIQGLDIIKDSEGNYRTISNILEDGEIVGTMFNRITADLSIDLDCFYEVSGKFALVKSLTENENGEFIYGGTDNKNTVDNPRLTITPSCQKSQGGGGDLLFDGPSNNFVASQVIAIVSGYAMVGTNETGAGTTDVFFALFDQSGAARTNFTQLYNDTGTYDGIGDESAEGLAITSTADGGFMIVGSTLADTGGEIDILLIKTNAFGDIQWTKVIGDVNEEHALHVEQAPDGGYLILGNTEFGGIDTMVLMKTDKNGNVN